MWTIPNFLSLFRGLSAFVFLSEDPVIRAVTVGFAMITDVFDGYLARKSRKNGGMGKILDPMMDKFFVLFCLLVFVTEERLKGWEALLLLSRDLALSIFGTYLYLTGSWKQYRFRSIKWGKITTFIQFVLLINLSLGYSLPRYLFISFTLFGILVLLELFSDRKSIRSIS